MLSSYSPTPHKGDFYTRKTHVFLNVTAPVIHKLWLNWKLSASKPLLSPFATTPLSLGWEEAWWSLLSLCKRSDPHCVFWEGFSTSVLQCWTKTAKDQIIMGFFIGKACERPWFFNFGSDGFHQPLTKALAKVKVENSHERLWVASKSSCAFFSQSFQQTFPEGPSRLTLQFMFNHSEVSDSNLLCCLIHWGTQ